MSHGYEDLFYSLHKYMDEHSYLETNISRQAIEEMLSYLSDNKIAEDLNAHHQHQLENEQDFLNSLPYVAFTNANTQVPQLN